MEDWPTQLKTIGADLAGHFLLTTGKHSSRFFMLARIAEHPKILQQWCQQLWQQLQAYHVTTFVGAAMGGILPAYGMAAVANGRALTAEKTPDGPMEIYHGALRVGEPVIVIEDAVATGFSIHKVMHAVEAQGAQVRAIGAFVDRGTAKPWTVPFVAVYRVPEPIPIWEPVQCPLCAAGLPLVTPKSPGFRPNDTGSKMV